MVRFASRLDTLIAETVAEAGYEFVGCETSKQGRNPVLRIYVDAENGITINEITEVNKAIIARLRVELADFERYTLEVSSPGLDRPLFTLAHYQQFLGKKLKIKLCLGEQGRKLFVGHILAVQDEQVVLSVDGEEHSFAFGNIAKAKLVPEF